MEAKNEKSKTTLFFQTYEVSESKVPLLFFLFGLQAKILTFCAFYDFIYLAKISSEENPCSLKIALPFLK